MEIFRLDKAIDNEKWDLEMAIAQLKKAKEQLSQSLKRIKYLAIQMNDYLYTKVLEIFMTMLSYWEGRGKSVTSKTSLISIHNPINQLALNSS